MQQSSKMVGWGSKRGYKTKERAHARYASRKTTAAWEEYATARNKVKKATVEKKGIWKDLVNKTNEDFEGGVKQMWVGIAGILGKQAGESDTGITRSNIKKKKW